MNVKAETEPRICWLAFGLLNRHLSDKQSLQFSYFIAFHGEYSMQNDFALMVKIEMLSYSVKILIVYYEQEYL